MKISPNEFMHPRDRMALEQLEAIPGFPTLVKKIMDIGLESFWYGVNMGSYIRLSERQLPEIYRHLPPICAKLGIEEPELYLEMNPVPNAYTYGDTRIFVTLTSGLLECLTDEELDAVIAHECGHILCRHVLYHTIADFVKNFAEALGVLGALIIPVRYALFYWYRMSELSCDRAAALITSPEVLSSAMARLSGGPKSITEDINFDEWAKQADEYERIRQDGTWNKTLQTLAVMNLSHPFAAVRVREVREWCRTEDYARLKRLVEKNGLLADKTLCPQCHSEINPEWAFCNYCGCRLK